MIDGMPQSEVLNGKEPKQPRNWRRLPRLLWAAFRIIWVAAPRQMIATALLIGVQGAAIGIQIVILRNLLAILLPPPSPSAVGASAALPDMLTQLLVQVAILIGLQAVGSLGSVYQNFQQQVLAELVQISSTRPIMEVAASVELREFDVADFHDRLQRAQLTVMTRPMMLTMAALGVARGVVTTVGLAAALFVISPLLLGVALLGVIPLALAGFSVAHSVFRFHHMMTPHERRRSYLLKVLTDRDMAKEVRVFGLADFLKARYNEMSAERLVELRTSLTKRFRAALGGATGFAFATGLTILVVGFLVLTHRLGLAAAGAAVMASFQIGGQLQMMSTSGSQIYECALFIEDLESLVATLPLIRAARAKASEPAPAGFSKIEVRNVTFVYPGLAPVQAVAPGPEGAPNGHGKADVPIGVGRAPHGPMGGGPGMRGGGPMTGGGPMAGGPPMMNGDPAGRPDGTDAIKGMGTKPRDGRSRPPALSNVSLDIQAGEVVALVGENGSGKTTLAKLVCGLYPPDKGAILWDGQDIARFDGDGLRSQITVLFQDFVRYMFTASDNIGVGNIDKLGDMEDIKRAADEAGASSFIEKWPEGYSAMLTPAFEGGRDLSVGQWQRIALARAFFRDAPLIILDEPTAALDARAEADLFARTRTLFQGRSVLLISHRFSSVRTADRIYVLKDGHVIESGTHDHLVALDGYYAELYNLQASAFLQPAGKSKAGQ
jgi:ABC-type multidrug transport system fused ATPase/permease subunit